MSAHFEIPTWANGPDGTGNGGYAAGCIAEACGLHGGAVEVNLRLPPPLGEQLTALWSDDDDTWHVRDGAGAQVATARRTTLTDLEIPRGAFDITAERAAAASAGFPYADHHPFPRCLCCGNQRPDDAPSLNLHCGRVDGTEFFADAWTDAAEFADPEEPAQLTRASCFSALDCPSATPFADPARPAVLARFEVELLQPASSGEDHVVVAWELGRDGRKLTSASALVDAGGDVIGVARALWIEVRRP